MEIKFRVYNEMNAKQFVYNRAKRDVASPCLPIFVNIKTMQMSQRLVLIKLNAGVHALCDQRVHLGVTQSVDLTPARKKKNLSLSKCKLLMPYFV